MKKIKNLRTILTTGILALSVFASIKMTLQDYKFLRVEFLNHAKGQTQHFITSFIN